MRYFFVIFALFLNGAIEKAAGVEWEIIVHREDTVVNEDSNVFSTDTPISAEQPITFKKKISTGSILGSGTILMPTNKNTEQIRTFDYVDPCEEYDVGSWEDVISKIILKAWLPNGKCPVEPGEYTINEPIGPMTVEIDEKLTCDKYILDMNLESNENNDIISSSKYVIDISKFPYICYSKKD